MAEPYLILEYPPDSKISHSTRPTSVLFGKDSEAIERLLSIHCTKQNPKILDCTYGRGVFWKHSKRNIVRSDRNLKLCGLNIAMDFSRMAFRDGSFDVIIFDPPHLPTAGYSEFSTIGWETCYGITLNDPLRDADNVSALFLPFLVEAKRVLMGGGIVLAKIADIVHNHRYQWQHCDFISDATRAGMTPCDLLIKCDPAAGNLLSGKWRATYHLRKAHCYWIVVRNSSKCEIARA